ncbi:MAG TPA: 1-deoxy-D-xylulose-5-phosphate synthase [Candidatus Polarisedimenticolia bacterium]|nr:1-deoxy-D-xylulose-5-phosphate synthase [Candidatus Polarisedimenticolia bacterium]
MAEAITGKMNVPAVRGVDDAGRAEARTRPRRSGPLLETIEAPADLKRLSVKELKDLAAELRQYIIDVVSRTGGHLAPSLGTVELTIALHYVFDAPRDRIVWDVGHQAYGHKVLTGRRDRLPTLRQYRGLSGFVTPSESPYDAFGVAHASTSIAAAMGMVVARDRAGDTYHVVTVTGDGAMTGGLAYEGLNNAGHSGRDLLVILNDNEMSISPNVGAISKYLTTITSSRYYNRLKEEIRSMMRRMPLGEEAEELAKRLERSLKEVVVPGGLFQALGFQYYGPIDGHDLSEMIPVLQNLRRVKGPRLLHVITKKGKGYSFAEANSCVFHGVSAFDPASGVMTATGQAAAPDYNKVFAHALTRLAAEDDRVMAITAAMADGTGLVGFREAFPDRFFDVGIAEGFGVTFAAGMAISGLRPVAAIYSTFLQRAYDQVIHDVGVQRLPVVFCLDRAGLVGADGPTHHGVFDLSYLRAVPNFVVAAPRDGDELCDLLHTAIAQETHPFAIRYPKRSSRSFSSDRPFQTVPIGSWVELHDGADACLLAVGSMVETAEQVRADLRPQGIDLGVVNCRFVKPLDEAMLRRLAGRVPVLITLEENTLRGGFGSGVHEFLQEQGLTVGGLWHIGLPDRFVAHGSVAQLLDEVGLSAERVAERVRLLVRGRA